MSRCWCCLLLGVLGACAGEVEQARPLVTRGDLEPRVLLTGEVVAEDAEALIAPNVGVWPLQLRWMIEDGATVTAGDLVADLDTSQLTSNLDQLRNEVDQREQAQLAVEARTAADIASARLAVETAEAGLAKARLEADLPLEIFAAREADRRRVELAKAELELAAAVARRDAAGATAAAEIELARGQLALARAHATRLEADIDRLSLRAPRDGIVVLSENPREGRAPRVGDTIWPGQAVATMPNLSSLVIEARLFDTDEGAVAVGLPAKVVLDAFGDRSVAARVREVDQTARELARSPLRRAFRVVLSLDEAEPELLRPGMSARVEVLVPPVRDVVLVPRPALRWEGSAPKLRLEGGREVGVTLGACDAGRCAVVDGPAEGTVLEVVR